MAPQSESEKPKRSIIVPWDFTPLAGHALEHAVLASRTTGGQVKLLHILPEDRLLGQGADKQKIIREAQAEMDKTTALHRKSDSISLQGLVKQGSVFTTINEAARQHNAKLLVMGTHGMQGMQRITGSFALKVIAGSAAPFLVVQGPPRKKRYENLVCPIDWVKTTNQKLVWAKYMHDHYHTRIHLLVNQDKKEFNARKQKMHYQAAVRFMEENQIDHTIIKREGQNLSRETLQYATEKKMDMILIMVTKGIEATDYILGASEQYLICNMEKIPVMCINTKTNLANYK